MLPRRSSSLPSLYSLWVCNRICYSFDGLEEPSGPWSTRYYSSLAPSPLSPPEITAFSLLFKVSHQRERGGGKQEKWEEGYEERSRERLKDVSIALLWGDQSGLFLQPCGTIMVSWSQSESPRCSRCCNMDD